MKNKLIFLIIGINIFSISLKADSVPSFKHSDTIKQQSAYIVQQKQVISDLIKRIEILEKENDRIIPINSLEYASFFVAALSLLLAIFLGYATYLSFSKIKEADRQIEKFGKDFKENIGSYEKEVNRFDKQILTYSNEFKEKINKFDLDTKSKLKEIEKMLDVFKENSEKIKEIEKNISGHQTYIKQGFESLFDFFLSYGNSKNDKDILLMVLIKRSISNIYSFDETDRFSGITTLGQLGSIVDIKHLEYVLKNPNESESNKLLANKAIVSIEKRTKP